MSAYPVVSSPHRAPERLEAEAAHLRRRAHELHALSGSLEAGPVWQLPRLADDDTWHSPRIALCRVTLATNLGQLARAVDAVRWRARQLERQADQLDLDARAARQLTTGGIA